MSPEVIETNLDDYKKLVESIKSDGFEMMVDLTVVDWFRKKVPRFEIIVQLLSTTHNYRKTFQVQISTNVKPMICLVLTFLTIQI